MNFGVFLWSKNDYFFSPKKKKSPKLIFFLISINLGSEISFFGVPEAEKGVFIFRPRGEIRPSKGMSLSIYCFEFPHCFFSCGEREGAAAPRISRCVCGGRRSPSWAIRSPSLDLTPNCAAVVLYFLLLKGSIGPIGAN